MDLTIKTLLFLCVQWIVVSSVGAMIEYDCTGQIGVCRPPSSCLADFEDKCLEEGSICCPEVVDSFEIDDVMERSYTDCSNRKCLWHYNGWWENACSVGARTLFYCAHYNKYCCAQVCRMQSMCAHYGGHCVSNRYRCKGRLYTRLCKGYSCYCCIPYIPTTVPPTTTLHPYTTLPTTTTVPPTTTLHRYTTLPTTTTLHRYTTLPTTTTVPPTTTLHQYTTLPTTTTVPPTTTAPPTITGQYYLPPCYLTGKPGVVCNYPKSCSSNGNLHGIKSICPISNCPPKIVKCEYGWTVIIYRSTLVDPPQDFKQKWTEYREGFGDGSGEYWLGNEILHVLTGNSPYQMKMIGIKTTTDTKTSVYGDFSVGSEATNYTLTVEGYDSAASTGIDLFINPPTNNIILTGMQFSTQDRDNDHHSPGGCTDSTTQHNGGGGWWYNDCTGFKATYTKHIDWYYWNAPDYIQARLKTFYIMIKP